MLKRYVFAFCMLLFFSVSVYSQRETKPYPAVSNIREEGYIGMTVNHFLQSIKQGNSTTILHSLDVGKKGVKSNYKRFQNKIDANKELYFDLEISKINNIQINGNNATAKIVFYRGTDKNVRSTIIFNLVKRADGWKIVNYEDIGDKVENGLYKKAGSSNGRSNGNEK